MSKMFAGPTEEDEMEFSVDDDFLRCPICGLEEEECECDEDEEDGDDD